MTAEPASAGALPHRPARLGLALRFVLAALAAATAIGAAVVGRHGGAGSQFGWLMLVLVWLTGAAAIAIARAHRRARPGAERARTLVFALATALAAEVVIVASALHLLVGWPPRLLQIAAAATLAVAAAAVIPIPKRFGARFARLLVPAISVAGLSALVAGIYLVVVVGLGRPPAREERTLLVLSILAAGISAFLFAPARRRLNDFANRLVHGERRAPDELVRTFGARLSRAIPLDELLLQLAESLRRVLALEAAEVWTSSGGALERVAADPDRGPATLRLSAAEEAVLVRAGVSGPSRIRVWLPELVAERSDALVRVAPIAQSGELFGLIVAERELDTEPFDEEADTVLVELARQVGPALRNVRLDSDLRASLGELRRQAVELRLSRARVVAAADDERRRIERDLHDGAQQHLVALEANLGAVRGLIDSDPERAQAILGELRAAVQQAMQDFRNLAHGIYPPLLLDRGLSEALANAARRATIPARLNASTRRRFDSEIETTVYFCCLEALQNAAKHAGESAQATILLYEEEDALLFEVADDGLGLDPARATFGAGLTNMRDRLDAIGGELRIESNLGHGTRVVGKIPTETHGSRSAR